MKIREDLLLLECYARPNNPRQAVRRTDEGGTNLLKFYIASHRQPVVLSYCWAGMPNRHF